MYYDKIGPKNERIDPAKTAKNVLSATIVILIMGWNFNLPFVWLPWFDDVVP